VYNIISYNGITRLQVISNDNAGKNKSYEKKTNSEFVEFVSISQKLHPFKNPHRLPTEPMEIRHSPHTHTIPIPMGIPMGIPIPTAALGRGHRIYTQNKLDLTLQAPKHCATFHANRIKIAAV